MGRYLGPHKVGLPAPLKPPMTTPPTPPHYVIDATKGGLRPPSNPSVNYMG